MAAVELFTFENSLLCINKYNSNKIQMGLTTSPFLDLNELPPVSFLKRTEKSKSFPTTVIWFLFKQYPLSARKQNILLNSLIGQDKLKSAARFRFTDHFSFFGIFPILRDSIFVCVLARGPYARENKQFKFHLSENDREII